MRYRLFLGCFLTACQATSPTFETAEVFCEREGDLVAPGTFAVPPVITSVWKCYYYGTGDLGCTTLPEESMRWVNGSLTFLDACEANSTDTTVYVQYSWMVEG